MSHEPAENSMDTTPQKPSENGQPGSLCSGDLLAQLENEIRTDAALENKCRKQGNKMMAHFYKGRVAAQQQMVDYLRATLR